MTTRNGDVFSDVLLLTLIPLVNLLFLLDSSVLDRALVYMEMRSFSKVTESGDELDGCWRTSGLETGSRSEVETGIEGAGVGVGVSLINSLSSL